MIVTPTCRFCQGYLKSGGNQTGGYGYTKLIYHCEKCHSQQMYRYDASPCDFSFEFHLKDYYYYIYFDPLTMKLSIAKVTKHTSSLKWKRCLDIKLSEFPVWLRPNNMTEERIKTMMVFS